MSKLIYAKPKKLQHLEAVRVLHKQYPRKQVLYRKHEALNIEAFIDVDYMRTANTHNLFKLMH